MTLFTHDVEPPAAGLVSLNRDLQGYEACGQAGEFLAGQEVSLVTYNGRVRVRVVRVERLEEGSLQVGPVVWEIIELDTDARWLDFDVHK